MKTPTAIGLILATAAAATCLTHPVARGDAAADADALAARKPGLHLEAGVVLADGGTVHVLNAPLVGANGQVAQRLDITLHLAGEPGGTLRVDQLTAAPTTLGIKPAEQFIPGVYLAPDGNKFRLRGPALAVAGRTTWAFTFEAKSDTAKDDAKPIKFDASWTVGPAIGNPDLSNQPDLKTLPDGFAYGFVTYDGFDLGYRWNGGVVCPSTVFGVRQIGDALQLGVFNHNGATWIQQMSVIFTPQH